MRITFLLIFILISSIFSQISQGGSPIPVDISSDWLISPEAIEAAITKNTVGIMPTQLNGRCCDMDKILEIAKKYSLFVVSASNICTEPSISTSMRSSTLRFISFLHILSPSTVALEDLGLSGLEFELIQ